MRPVLPFPVLTITVVSLFFSVALQAVPLTFVNTQPLTTFGGTSSTTFTLDSSQSPSTVGSYFFIFNNVPVLFNGVTHLQEVGFEAFTDSGGTVFALNIGTSIGFVNGGILTQSSEILFEPFITPSVLFTGSTSQPVYQLGTFTDFTYPESLTVTAGTPEPSAAALFASGLFATWCLMQRRSSSQKCCSA